ncbi:hypothetical protein [Streptomyces sp. NBC_01518]|uniref:hypothetical protein n=1 Tax=Streptomyces sp. NBC_01518 TaxID=2903891 RepID=UPI003867577F
MDDDRGKRGFGVGEELYMRLVDVVQSRGVAWLDLLKSQADDGSLVRHNQSRLALISG